MTKIHPVKPHNVMQHLDLIIRNPRICSKANYCGSLFGSDLNNFETEVSDASLSYRTVIDKPQ